MYRDNGLAGFRIVTGPHCGKIKKEFQKLFRQHGLKSIIKCNLKIADLQTLLTNLTISLMTKVVIFIRNQTTHLNNEITANLY